MKIYIMGIIMKCATFYVFCSTNTVELYDL